MHFQRGWILVIIGMMVAVGLETLQLRGVMACLGLITAGLGSGQFLTVLGDVRFDRIHSEFSKSGSSNFVEASAHYPHPGTERMSPNGRR